MLDQELCDKSMQLQGSATEDKSDILEKIQALQMERDQLLRRRNSMDEKLKDGKVLSTEIVGLRESERKLQVQIEEQELKSIHQKNMMCELESALEHLKLQCDRQLTHQRQEHEKKIQFILNHFKEQNSEGIAETLKGYEVKIQQLEKDLFFYKKTSRELKKKLKDLLGESSE
ncbi:hypothetical protein DUI87_03765 [Hirundo rustica rustica]|uniref:Uncharacterized protein n=1 Tax=Hirundo rustica rustica TaxID=333673 RepID=A0A3M0L2D9_HIRRU|nr:hypothetical protein DUI87_03765 [Hirundo rustica rustica]